MRVARLIIPGVVHHIISRFVDRDWFFNDDVERDCYLHYVGRALEDSDWRYLSYALMSNHVHHAAIAGEEPFGDLSKRVHSPFAAWMNKRHARLGGVFADRPSTWAIRPEHVGATIAYIHNNPVRARVVREARDSTWTSHRAYVGESAAPSWLHVTEGLALGGLAPAELDAEAARYAWSAAKQELARIHHAANKRGAVELATPTATPTVVPLVARPFARIRPEPRAVLEVVGNLLQLEPDRFASRDRDPRCVRARTIAVHAAKALGLTGSDIASALGVSRQLASKLARRRLDEGAIAVVRLTCERLTSFTPSPLRVRSDKV
jgi:REP element-mobilizing transposase RayT